MSLTLGTDYKVYFPNNTEDAYDTYIGKCIGLHTDSNDSANNYSVLSIMGKGNCEIIYTADESTRTAKLQ